MGATSTIMDEHGAQETGEITLLITVLTDTESPSVCRRARLYHGLGVVMRVGVCIRTCLRRIDP